jgi:DNA-binding NtrC family response regulator
MRADPQRHRGASILVIDDEAVIREVLQRLLSRAGYRVTTAATGARGLELGLAGGYDLILLDLMLPDRSGMDVLRDLLASSDDAMVLMMTAYATVETAVEAMRAGAHHYLTKPFKNEEVMAVIANALEQRFLRDENRRLKQALAEKRVRAGLVGKSASMQEVFRLLEQVAPSRSTVLVQGESGTGKELVARAIHDGSDRADGPFVIVHSGNIPADLLESNLFGHTRGAFTGAVAAKKGLFEVADGGTIFFDEISTVRADVQAKLLRVMQEKEFLPLGATRSVRVDVRIVAATNVELRDLVQQGEFRQDLYYRLNVIAVVLPPLRERHGDIPLLAEHFVRQFAAENDRPVRRITAAALQRMLDYPWPGNVRELENAMERAVVLSRGPEIDVDLLPDALHGRPPSGAPELPEGVGLPEALEDYEKSIIQRTLQRTGGVQKEAARILGLKPTTLHEKIKRLGIRV